MDDHVEATLLTSVTVIYYAIACMVLFMFVRFFTLDSTSVAQRTEEKQSVAQMARADNSATGLAQADPEVTVNAEQVLNMILTTDPAVPITVAGASIDPTVRKEAIEDADPDKLKIIKSQCVTGKYIRKTKYDANGVQSIAFIKKS